MVAEIGGDLLQVGHSTAQVMLPTTR